MKKLFLFSTILLSTLYSHECHYKLNINLDLDKELVKGYATIKSDHPTMKLLDSRANILKIKNATLNISANTPQLVKQDANKSVEISFSHNFKPINGDIILLEDWYPKIDMMCSYETIISNSNITSVVEATKTTQHKDGKSFNFDYPLSRIHLVASKNYVLNSKITKEDMTLSTYFYPEDSHLSDKYLQKTQEYFRLYKNMFGFMPFKNFSVIETPFPAGYSMPTFTLIGKQIVDKDFVLDNSLGHEIAHQWFGNYVYAPYRGNWVEGITTFYSDYLYAKKNFKEVDYRKDMLIKYDSYVNSNNEISLIEFKHKKQESSDAIGYSKATFFFYMLERKIGKEAFDNGVKELLNKYKYKVATYKNLREIFEKTSEKKLLDFFKTWVYKKGALEFKVNNIDLKYIQNNYVLKFDITNNLGSGYLPMSICSDDECLYTKIDLSKKNQRIELDIEPTKIIFDGSYEIFRKLDLKEIPPTISKIIQGNAILVIDKADEKRFSKFKHAYKNFKYADEVTYKELKNNNIFILGSKNSLLEQIAVSFEMQGDAKIELFKNPLNEKNVIAVFDMKKLSKSIFYKLRHLGKYSTIIFKDGNIIQKTTKPSLKGVTYTINSSSLALKPQAQKFNKLIGDIAKSKVVFIGEKHTEFSSHLNQLKIIKEMYKKNKKLAIAMEMFQKPYQKYLDAFVEGKITEKEMIIKTEYFKRWKYDYELYRPILLFAKEKRIPIIAINIDREITKKVVKEGIDALSDKQQALLPNSIDFAATKYKEELKMIYGMHQSGSFKNFDEFYHAQLIWDESMAANIVGFIEKKPDYSVAVLAGNGHIMYGYGIPSRIQRRGIKEYTIALNLTNPEPGIADYILYPSTIGTQKSKKLGVFLKDGKKLEVLKFVEKSLAKKAGMKVGDTIVAFNATPVKTLDELKTELAFVKDDVKLTLIRDSKKIDIDISFLEK